MSGVLFFDGACGMCTRSRDFLLKLDRTGDLQTEPLQRAGTAERLGISPERLMEQVWWLDSSGQVYGGAEAANAAVSAALGTRLPLLGLSDSRHEVPAGGHLPVGRRPSLPLPRQDPVLRVAPGRLLTALGNGEPTIRPTVPDDLDAIGEIYAHHVRTGVATFEMDPPDAAGMDAGGSIRSSHAGCHSSPPRSTAQSRDTRTARSGSHDRPTGTPSRTRSTSHPTPSAGASAAACSMRYWPAAQMPVSGRSSPSSWTTTPTLPLRCTAIGASSTPAG